MKMVSQSVSDRDESVDLLKGRLEGLKERLRMAEATRLSLEREMSLHTRNAQELLLTYDSQLAGMRAKQEQVIEGLQEIKTRLREQLQAQIAEGEAQRQNLGQEHSHALAALQSANGELHRQLQHHISELVALRVDHGQMADSLLAANASMRASHEQMVAGLQEMNARLHEQLQAQIAEGEAQRQSLGKDHSHALAALQSANGEFQRQLQLQLSEFEASRVDHGQVVAGLLSVNANLLEKLDLYKKQLDSSHERASMAIADRALLQQQIEMMGAKAQQLQAHLDKSHSESSSLLGNQQLLLQTQQTLRLHVERLEAELETARTSIDMLNEQKTALELRGRHATEKLALTSTQLDVSHLELEQLKAGSAHQLAVALSKATRSWAGLRQLPGSVSRVLYRRYRGRAAQASLEPGQLSNASGGDGGKPFLDWIAEGTVEAIERFATLPSPDRAAAQALTTFAKAQSARTSTVALEAARQAVRLDPADYRVKWLAMLCFEAGRISEALSWLDQVGGEANWLDSEKQRAEQIRGAARLLSQTPAVPPRAIPAQTAIAGRMAYVVASSLPFHQTGYTLRTQALSLALSHAGMDVHCLTRPGYPEDRADAAHIDVPEKWQEAGVSYQRLAGAGRRLPPDVAIGTAADILQAAFHKLNPALVQAASNHENALPALLAARRAGIPFVYEVRGLWELTAASRVDGWESSERYQLDVRLETLVAKEADLVLAINGPVADLLIQRGVPAERIRLATNAVDPELASVPADAQLPGVCGTGDFVIGYAGSLVGYEGLDDLIVAIANMRDEFPGVRGLIIGRGDAEDDLRSLVAELKAEDLIHFAGQISTREARRLLASCDCAAIPRKPWNVCHVVSPLKPLEAMALGVPVVASDARATVEMIEPEVTGLSFAAGDALALQTVLSRLASDAGLRQRLSLRARQWVLENRTWPQLATTMIGHYSQLLAEPVPGDTSVPSLPVLTHLLVEVAEGASSLSAEDKQAYGQALTHVYENHGAAAVRELAVLQGAAARASLKAYCHLAAARLLLEMAEDEDANHEVHAALDRSRSHGTLCGAMTLLFKLGDDEGVKRLAAELQASGGMRDAMVALLEQSQLRTDLFKSMSERAAVANPDPRPEQATEVVVNFLHFSLPYTSVGYATRSHGIAMGVRACGWDLRPCTRLGFPHDFKPELEGVQLPPEDVIDGVTYRRIPGNGRKGSSEIAYLAAAADACQKILVEERASLVHAASNYTTALPALVAARRMGLPFIYEIRGFWEITRSSRDPDFERSQKFRDMKRYEEAVVAHADHIITITSAMRDELMERGVPPEQISLAYNSVDVDRFHPLRKDEALANRLGIAKGVPVIGYVGSFVDYEGLDDLLRAASLLRDRGLEFSMLMVGDGAVMESLKEQVSDLNLADRVVLTGRVPHEEVEAHYSLIDIAPFPRKPWEVCELVSPLKPFEAMAMHKPVVVSTTRALMEIVTDGHNGLLFEKGSVTSLADALERLLRDPSLRIQLGENSRRWVEENRSWRRAGQDVCAAYAKVLQSRRQVVE